MPEDVVSSCGPHIMDALLWVPTMEGSKLAAPEGKDFLSAIA